MYMLLCILARIISQKLYPQCPQSRCVHARASVGRAAEKDLRSASWCLKWVCLGRLGLQPGAKQVQPLVAPGYYIVGHQMP
jgi:hypothetical protein